MQSYHAHHAKILDALEEVVCVCKNKSSARRIAGATNRAERALYAGPPDLFIPPALLEGLKMEWPDVSLVDNPEYVHDPSGQGKRAEAAAEIDAARRGVSV